MKFQIIELLKVVFSKPFGKDGKKEYIYELPFVPGEYEFEEEGLPVKKVQVKKSGKEYYFLLEGDSNHNRIKTEDEGILQVNDDYAGFATTVALYDGENYSSSTFPDLDLLTSEDIRDVIEKLKELGLPYQSLENALTFSEYVLEGKEDAYHRMKDTDRFSQCCYDYHRLLELTKYPCPVRDFFYECRKRLGELKEMANDLESKRLEARISELEAKLLPSFALSIQRNEEELKKDIRKKRLAQSNAVVINLFDPKSKNYTFGPAKVLGFDEGGIPLIEIQGDTYKGGKVIWFRTSEEMHRDLEKAKREISDLWNEEISEKQNIEYLRTIPLPKEFAPVYVEITDEMTLEQRNAYAFQNKAIYEGLIKKSQEELVYDYLRLYDQLQMLYKAYI